MSTYFKQNKCTISCATCLLLIFGLVTILNTLMGKTGVQPTFTYISDCFGETLQNKTLATIDWIVPDVKEIKNRESNSNMENLNMDFVQPIKIHHYPLNSDDLLYESKRNHSQKDFFSAYSVTGNFRSKSNKIWDPHPEYTLTVFGKPMHLILHQDNSFIVSNTFQVIRILNNNTEVHNDGKDYLGCYYKGYVRGDSQSSVAVSLCSGMTGHIKSSFGTFLIQPAYKSINYDRNLIHKVWRHSNRQGQIHVPGDLNMKVNDMPTSLYHTLVRKKRSFVDKQLFTMEVLVAVDKSMSEFHKSDLNSYILTLISVVSNIFSDASIGNSINISVPTIVLLKDDINMSRGKKTTSASQLLKHFCSFLHKKRIHYDTAIMLTRDQICRNEGEAKCDTLGLAELGTVCKSYSCSIVQDNGLPAAFTIAHELGHILNMPHDDDSRCLDFKRYGKSTLHIMSSTMGDDIHPWSWSDCSRHYVSEFLEKEDTTCLEDTPQINVPKFGQYLPGEQYTLDEQCRLIHGNFSKYCSVEDDCRKLWCKEEQLSSCRSSNLPWADGTPCGNNASWCQQGKCMSREEINRKAVNGGWGSWSTFTPCSMTCGGGVQESQRECNNPFPKNGGKYCGGSRKKFRSCNTQNCPPGSLDAREQQCYDMNGNNFGLKGIDSSVRWIPKYGLIAKDKCKLYCRWDNTTAYFQLSEKVKDGTTCSFDSFDKCVNGICRPAGCDNELNSVATLDKCGVCEGRNNTCEEYSGHFYKSDLSEKNNSMYYYVTTIPKGSSNILITQPEYHTQNYIVLRSSDKESLLNGERVINVYRHVFFYAGVPFEYNGSNNVIEKVNTTYSRKLKKDLIVQIISLNLESMKNDAILLSYSYTAEKRYKMEPYQWRMKDWSSCDALCQGSSFRTAECINLVSDLKVAPPFCDSSKKPRTQYRACNTDCYITLNISSISACSASCGTLGSRQKTFNCIQTYIDTNISHPIDLSFCESRYEIHFNEDCREGCWDYSDWSPCSQTCGNGQQVRSVACFFNGTQVENSLCDMSKRSIYNSRIRSCNLGHCTESSTFKEAEVRNKLYWKTDDWGHCDDNCEKIRTVSCSNGYGCSIGNKPIEKKKCCMIKYVATWSPCSVECGVGIRKKEFYCAKVFKSAKKGLRNKREQIDSKYCSLLRIPTPNRLKKTCKVACKWIPDAWSTCVSDCSTEYQTRPVNCTNILGRQISSRFCDALKKPIAKQMCPHCVRREYKITKCNCEGYRKRRVVCSDSYGKIIQCPNKQKILKEKCRPPEECFPKSCADVKRFHEVLHDGEYHIFIKKKLMKIYCHNMNGKPKEYITLNPSDNYSIYYDNKTKSPDMCPPASRKFEYKDFDINGGRTHFRKVAIDIVRLRVIENDFTFADTVGTQQPFGSAGDCYNQNGECPQGDFSINFNTTGFSISSKTKWDMFGNRAVIKTPNNFHRSATNRRAFCGGHCGRCAISTRSGLVLDV
ncbi:A disintegrin and metalloproteinase with thrombospondin motifs 9 isoform X2 [Eupeodes corollae]|nr:A disintegrin and metalloproteinase with thrombospondin motifs 9 isoform X2 [Eupeodes corollae]XP_055922962.1 A disintegrin and metalloproteinase with thrombospondin motifs 9 isoform X2 [Eupeodes corollae]XP_055922963.1 A disintegrin and metalloproteinase with thrombospondin motifs 9 isoform X2 [Eupeodes corollae]